MSAIDKSVWDELFVMVYQPFTVIAPGSCLIINSLSRAAIGSTDITSVFFSFLANIGINQILSSVRGLDNIKDCIGSGLTWADFQLSKSTPIDRRVIAPYINNTLMRKLFVLSMVSVKNVQIVEIELPLWIDDSLFTYACDIGPKLLNLDALNIEGLMSLGAMSLSAEWFGDGPNEEWFKEWVGIREFIAMATICSTSNISIN